VLPRPTGSAGEKELPSQPPWGELDAVAKEEASWKAGSGHLQCTKASR